MTFSSEEHDERRTGRGRDCPAAVQSAGALIGDTPLVELQSLDGVGGSIFIKMESSNPSGSIRDRYLEEILERAVDAGQLMAGDIVAMAGVDDCTVSAAFLAGRLGLSLRVFAREGANPRLSPMLKRFGADLEWLDEATSGQRVVDRAAAWAREEPERFFINGYRHEAVCHSHVEIAEELLASLEGRPLGAFVTSVTTGGAYREVTRRLRRPHPDLIVGGAVLGDRDFPSLARSRRDVLQKMNLEEAWEMRDRLASEAGLLLGPKGAASVALALELRDRVDSEAAVVALNPDAGQRYLGWEKHPFVERDYLIALDA